jgi:hypothetical protein
MKGQAVSLFTEAFQAARSTWTMKSRHLRTADELDEKTIEPYLRHSTRMVHRQSRRKHCSVSTDAILIACFTSMKGNDDFLDST